MFQNRLPFFIAIFISFIIAALIIIFALSLNRLKNERYGMNRMISALEEAAADNTEAYAELRNLIYLLSEDLNESRRVIGLEQREYPLFREDVESESGSEQSFLPYFTAVEQLAGAFMIGKHAEDLRILVESEKFGETLAAYNLEYTFMNDTSFQLTSRGKLFYECGITMPDGSYFIRPLLGEESLFTSLGQLETAVASTIRNIQDHYLELEKQRENLSSLSGLPEIREVTGRKHLSISPLKENEQDYSISLKKKGETVLSISLLKDTLEYQAGGQTFPDFETLKNELPGFINTADVRTSLERRIDNVKEELLLLSRDPGFMAVLRSRGLTMSSQFRNDSEYHYLDIRNERSELVGSFAIYNFSGEVYLLDHEQVPIGSVRAFDTGTSTQKKN